MNDYWVDGHFIAADDPESALKEAGVLYGFSPEKVRPWTHEDELDDLNNYY